MSYRNRRAGIKILFVLSAILLLFALAFAQQGENTGHGEQTQSGHGEQAQAGHAEEGHHFDWTHFFGQVFNSTVLFGGLFFLLRKPIGKYLADQGLNIKDDIIRREQNLEKTAATLEQIRSRLDKIEEEVGKMKDEAGQGGREEKKKIEILGRQECDIINRRNEEEISQRVESAVRQLKEKIAELAIGRFKKEIEAELDENLHEKIIEKNIDISGEIIERE